MLAIMDIVARDGSAGRPLLCALFALLASCAFLGGCAATLERHRREARDNLHWQAAFDLECEEIVLTPLDVRPHDLITRYEVEGCGRSATYSLIPATRFGDWIDEADTVAVQEARRAERQNEINDSMHHRQTIRGSRRW